MTLQFAQPAAFGQFLKPAELNGHLILITQVHETFERHDELAGKDKLNARFNYVDLDGSQELNEDAVSSHPGIALRLKPHAGKNTPILGRIGQEPSTKAGFNPTWVLGEYAVGVDDVRAGAWLASHATKSVAAPSPVPAPVAAPSPVPAPARPSVTRAMADQMAANNIALPPGCIITDQPPF